jgi:hypothetical protein
MANTFSFVAQGSSTALVYDVSGGTLLATVPCDGVTVTLSLNVDKAWIVLKDANGLTQMAAPLYLNLNYFFPTVALPAGVTTDEQFQAAVREIGGLRTLSGRIKHASGDLATILHIASGYRPVADQLGVADLNGTSVVPVTVTALGNVMMTPASWTSLNLRASW